MVVCLFVRGRQPLFNYLKPRFYYDLAVLAADQIAILSLRLINRDKHVGLLCSSYWILSVSNKYQAL